MVQTVSKLKIFELKINLHFWALLICPFLLCLLSLVNLGYAQGVRAEYYSGRNFGELLRSEEGSAVSFDWEREGPYMDGPVDNFSVRWSGRIVADQTGTYQFRADYDDGYRLWVDDELIINGWSGGPAVIIGEVNLASGRLTPITIEFFEAGGIARSLLQWRLLDTNSEFSDISLDALRSSAPNTGLPNVGIAVRDQRALEGSDPARFTVYRMGDLESELEVQLNYSGEAEEGLDYADPPRTVTIAAGQHARDFEIRRVDDELARGTKDLVISISSTETYTLLRHNEITLRLLDDERDQSAVETFTIAGRVRGLPSAEKVTFKLETSDQATQVIQSQFGNGEFSFSPQLGGEYTLQAWLDENGDDLLSEGEQVGLLSLGDVVGNELAFTLPPHQLGIIIDFVQQEETAGTEEMTAGNEEVNAGNEEVTAGTEEETAGSEISTAGTDEMTAGAEEMKQATDAGCDQRDLADHRFFGLAFLLFTFGFFTKREA